MEYSDLDFESFSPLQSVGEMLNMKGGQRGGTLTKAQEIGDDFVEGVKTRANEAYGRATEFGKCVSDRPFVFLVIVLLLLAVGIYCGKKYEMQWFVNTMNFFKSQTAKVMPGSSSGPAPSEEEQNTEHVVESNAEGDFMPASA